MKYLRLTFIMLVVFGLGFIAWYIFLHYMTNVPREVRITLGLGTGYLISYAAEKLNKVLPKT